ncbi:MAG TPA: acetylxylan esterase [Microlunatus sp.]
MPDPAVLSLPDSDEFTSYPLTELLGPRPLPIAPRDFADFWRTTYAELTETGTDSRVERDESGTGRPVQRISFRSSTGDRVLGWLVGPVPGRPVRGGLVISHGYGSRAEPVPDIVPADAAAIFPVAPWLPDNPGSLPGSEHVLIGFGDRDRYAHRFSVADIWRAATVLIDHFPAAAERLDYRGGSFGGGIGALALPWERRFRRAVLDVPSFGDFPIRLSRRCTGSGEAVRQHLITHPLDRPMLDYFDSAMSAQLIMIPVQVSAARLDPAVDPRGQFAVYRALGGPKQLVVRTAGHAEFPGDQEENARVESAARDFLAAEAIPRSTIDLTAR